MKRFLLRLLTLALVLGLAAVALGPVAIRQLRLWRDGQIAAAYLDAAAALSPLDCGRLLTEARGYDEGRARAVWTDPFDPAAEPEADEAYEALLDPAGNGVMAVLEVPKLAATLPVYHGTHDAALGAGVGHLAGSSLPVGSAGGQCVLAARRGGWLAGPFAGLDRLIAGDCFYLHTLQDTLIYQVSGTSVVSPGELEKQDRGDGADEVILVTTAPYGSEELRLLVRGERVSRRSAQPTDDSRELPDWAARGIFALPVAAAGLLVLMLVEAVRRGVQRRRRRRMKL